MTLTSTDERPNSKTLDDEFHDKIMAAGYEIMMQRKETAAEHLREARENLAHITDPNLRKGYLAFLGKYEARWGELE